MTSVYGKSYQKNNQNKEQQQSLLEQQQQQQQQPNASDFIVLQEESKRERICIALFLFVFFAVLVGSLSVWLFHSKSIESKHIQASYKAKQAIQRLNQGLAPSLRETLSQRSHTCQATLLLTRHCEKYGARKDPDGTEHCSYMGHQRARYLASLFGTRWPTTPQRLFALTPQRDNHWNFRQYETLLPLAHQTQRNIETIVGAETLNNEIITLLQTDPHVCGNVWVVSWRHSEIPTLAVNWGCGPSQGCPLEYSSDEFDAVWLIQWVYYNNNSSATMNTTRLRGQLRSTTSSDWNVFGTVTYQDFDPLAYAWSSGEYHSDDL